MTTAPTDAPEDGADAGATAPESGPVRLSALLALAAAAVALLAGHGGEPPALAAGTFGVLAVAVGVASGARGWLGGGAAVLFLAALYAALAGASTLRVFVGVAAAGVAWDLGDNAVSLGRQVGRAAPTRRAELVHAATSIGIAALAVGAAAAAGVIGRAGIPVVALVALLTGAVLLATALRA